MRLNPQIKTYKIKDQTVKLYKAPTPWNHTHHRGHNGNPHWPQNLSCCQPDPTWLVLCLRLCDYTNYTEHQRTVKSLPLLEFFFFVEVWLLPSDYQINYFQHVTHIFLTMDNQKNKIRGETCLSLQIRVWSSLTSPGGRQYLTLHAGTQVSSGHFIQKLPWKPPAAPLCQCLRYHHGTTNRDH